MKRILDELKYVWPVFIFLFAVGYFIHPYIDGASEIFCPLVVRRLSRFAFVPMFCVLALVVPVVFLADCAYFVFAFIRKWSTLYKVIIAIPLVVLPVLWLTWTGRRVSAFPIGGKMCVRRAGGASKIIEEAIGLAGSTTDSSPPQSDWPESIKALGARNVMLEKGVGILRVEILRVNNFADQFGFYIQDANLPPPELTDHIGRPVFKQWRLADGIYLYEY